MIFLIYHQILKTNYKVMKLEGRIKNEFLRVKGLMENLT